MFASYVLKKGGGGGGKNGVVGPSLRFWMVDRLELGLAKLNDACLMLGVFLPVTEFTTCI